MEKLQHKLVVINKHKGPSSFNVVEAFRKASRIRKVGHAGTLDPLARGVLLLCTGRATRAVEHFMNLEKTYEFDVHLGVETDTLDAEGTVVREVRCPQLDPEEIDRVAKSFLGEYQLSPPAFSALKRDGQRLYELARAGEKPAVGRRTVTIYSLDILDIHLPITRLRLNCSRGTYVRSLAKDFGEKLGLPSHVASLTRTRIGPFSLDNAFLGEKLFNGDISGLEGIGLAKALDFMPGIVLKDSAKKALLSGMLPGERDVVRTIGDVAGGKTLRILDTDGELVAVGKRVEGKRKKLFWVDTYRLFTSGDN
ncbi:MAG: tRNA pseudouridine(55) synthase TruB [Candidatus Latescibacteria bacterium]|nr:tRNA pseudouridine(55) synthase TruB [Candidatus Latescibacterota bacterium]NIO27328.1 tRNA pseudouridine(55) synthase TruB [Candidatus Latescibacterota bacterium]NIO54852.1 tRNA pseudouridine(55) synthase TruB [Candidatus Latescibacterota bacterium]NIT00935.1 tRNA pseudouridine(55) synthase TruB [Candidatus Latescibacterota bacterium]NIT37858.1 tRNA pseudouridine(55) synthase TruB [Candidatus Latescibacterota bacterium]